MELISCGKGDIKIKLDKAFSGITVHAFGTRIMDYKGFSLSTASIKQISPGERKLSANEKEAIARAISQWEFRELHIEVR